MQLGDDFDPHHLAPHGDDGNSLGRHRHGLELFVGQDLAEPARRARDSENCAQNAHGRAGQEPGKQERQAKGEDDWPRRGRGQFNGWRCG